jgi:hypothetical protein
LLPSIPEISRYAASKSAASSPTDTPTGNTASLVGASTAAGSPVVNRLDDARNVRGVLIAVKQSGHSLLAPSGRYGAGERLRRKSARFPDSEATVSMGRVIANWMEASSISRFDASVQYRILRAMDVRIILGCKSAGRWSNYIAFRSLALDSHMPEALLEAGCLVVTAGGELPQLPPRAASAGYLRTVHALFNSFARCLAASPEREASPDRADTIEPPLAPTITRAGSRYEKSFRAGEFGPKHLRNILNIVDVFAAPPTNENECFEQRVAAVTLYLLMGSIKKLISGDSNFSISLRDFDEVERQYPDTLAKGRALYIALHPPYST